MSDYKLLPCPFCGGEAKVLKHTFMDDDGFEDIWGWSIECMDCHVATRGYNGEGQAIDAWNTRAQLSRQKGE